MEFLNLAHATLKQICFNLQMSKSQNTKLLDVKLTDIRKSDCSNYIQAGFRCPANTIAENSLLAYKFKTFLKYHKLLATRGCFKSIPTELWQSSFFTQNGGFS